MVEIGSSTIETVDRCSFASTSAMKNFSIMTIWTVRHLQCLKCYNRSGGYRIDWYCFEGQIYAEKRSRVIAIKRVQSRRRHTEMGLRFRFPQSEVSTISV